MKGTQKPDSETRQSMVVRIDSRMYDQCLEWANAEGVPIRAIVDAIMWHWFMHQHRHSDVRADARQQALAIAESIRTKGRARAEDLLPRWRKPVEKPAVPPPLAVPRAIGA